jgi:hypothetical protein
VWVEDNLILRYATERLKDASLRSSDLNASPVIVDGDREACLVEDQTELKFCATHVAA